MFSRELLQSLLPKSIQPLLNLVGPSFFKAVPWKELSIQGGILLKNLTDSDSEQKLLAKQRLTELLKDRNIFVDMEESRSARALEKEDIQNKQKKGELILELYFVQLQNAEGLFLDFRPQNFYFDGTKLEFASTNLWSVIDDNFRTSLLDLYHGFYLSDLIRFDKGLTGVGLMNSDMNHEQKNKIRTLFFDYFGADQEKVEFSIEHFVKAFENIFKFIIDQKNLKISGQFLYLGVYLASLYMALSSLKVSLNVKKAYHAAFLNMASSSLERI